MQDTREQYFEHHAQLFKRTQDRTSGECLITGAYTVQLFQSPHERIGIQGRVRTNKAGCQIRCELVMVVYPVVSGIPINQLKILKRLSHHFQQGRRHPFATDQ